MTVNIDRNAARTSIRDETSETDHTQKRRFRHSAIYQTIKALAILCCYLIWLRDSAFRGGHW
jgi:hypothetical protein